MLIFHKIRYKNILSSGNMFTEIQLDKDVMTVVQGTNGSGKSTLLDAICFVLFNKAYRKINKPTLVNNKNKKDLLVEIEFSSSGVEFKIRRGINPVIFEVYREGLLIDQNASNSDYQSHLEKNILKYDFNTFTQLVIIGKAMYVSFLKLDAAKRRSFIENMLSLSIFGIMADVHKKRVIDIKNQISTLNTQITVIKEKISIRGRYINDLEADFRQKKEASIKRIEDEIEHLMKSVQNLLEKLLETQNSIVEVDKNIDAANRIKIQSLSDFRVKFNLRIEQSKKDASFFKNTSECPTCSQDIKEDLKQNMIKSLTEKAKKAELALAKIRKDIEIAEAIYQETLEVTKRNYMLAEQCKTVNYTISEHNQRIKALNSSRDSEVPDRSKIDAAVTELDALNVDYESLRVQKEHALETQDYFELITAMLKDTGIKSMVIKKFVPIINNTINKNLKQLGFFVKFVLDENFNERIYSRGIDEMNYYNFSEGEKLRIDLAILLAWRELVYLQGNNTTNLIIFDEILDASLDQRGADNFLYMIESIQKVNIFIISHSETKWSEKTKPKITFVKDKGYSRMILT